MELRIERREPIPLAGMGFYGDPFGNASAWDEENEIGSLWKRFSAFLAASPAALPRPASSSGLWYELHILGPEAARSGRYEVFVGVELPSVAAISGIPPALSAKVLPAAEYAVAVLAGREIASDWRDGLYREISAGLGRTADPSLCIDLYGERFKGMDRLDESELEIWVPLLPGGMA